MPYVKQSRRDELDKDLQKIKKRLNFASGHSPGDLNYIITSILLEHIDDKVSRSVEGRVTYSMLNEAVGILECSKMELYRRIGSYIEDNAIYRNGDLPLYEKLGE